eukprot:TRINITY_DN20830_c0_g1_i2.p1 TRINITY_DN20830_c0_g1~~TRINITY_DN20830_c0_g1_i2.p1  ORF type:complete len:1221 (+),score=172.36 TRINITY_DN20830_c0_g1_i2:103-3765(+)
MLAANVVTTIFSEMRCEGMVSLELRLSSLQTRSLQRVARVSSCRFAEEHTALCRDRISLAKNCVVFSLCLVLANGRRRMHRPACDAFALKEAQPVPSLGDLQTSQFCCNSAHDVQECESQTCLESAELRMGWPLDVPHPIRPASVILGALETACLTCSNALATAMSSSALPLWRPRMSDHRSRMVNLKLALKAQSSEHEGTEAVWRETLPKDPRPYQIKAMDYFFQHAHETVKERQPLRFQMACGTGKTFTYGMIISRDVILNSDARYVVLVPWRELARQSAAELEAFGLDVAVVGDGGNPEEAEDAQVVVCVYASAHHLHGQPFRIKIVDEAHHLETVGKICSKQIRSGILADFEADFSATFLEQSRIHFQYDLATAIEAGYINDFRLTLGIFSGDNIQRELIHMICENQKEWAPMLIVFNKTESSERFAGELSDLGLHALNLDGTSSRQARAAAKHRMESLELDALCVVRVFNEGVSINALRTVIFADRRLSRVNVQQVALRVTRLHVNKQLGNVVVPMRLEDLGDDEEDMSRIVRALADVNSRLETRIIQRSELFFGTVYGKEASERAEALDLDEAKTMMTLTFDRLGRCLESLGSWGFDLNLQHLKQWVSKTGTLPFYCKVLDTAERRQQHRIARWLNKQGFRHRKGSLREDRRKALLLVPGMVERFRDWDAIRSFSWEERVQQLTSWINEHGQYPSTIEAEYEGRSCANWLRKVRRLWQNGALPEERLAEMSQDLTFSKLIELWDRLPSFCREYGTWDDRYDTLWRWVHEKGALPRFFDSGSMENKLEHQLGLWLGELRKQYQSGHLSQYNTEQLLKIPGMKLRIELWDLRAHHEWPNDWQECARRLEDWVMKNGVLPRHNAPEAVEATLGQWLHSLRRMFLQGALTDAQLARLRRIRLLDDRMVYWTAGGRNGVWDLRFTKLCEWMHLRGGQIPDSSSDALGRSLLKWIYQQRHKDRTGKLEHSQREKLLRIGALSDVTSSSECTSPRKIRNLRKQAQAPSFTSTMRPPSPPLLPPRPLASPPLPPSPLPPLRPPASPPPATTTVPPPSPPLLPPRPLASSSPPLPPPRPPASPPPATTTVPPSSPPSPPSLLPRPPAAPPPLPPPIPPLLPTPLSPASSPPAATIVPPPSSPSLPPSSTIAPLPPPRPPASPPPATTPVPPPSSPLLLPQPPASPPPLPPPLPPPMPPPLPPACLSSATTTVPPPASPSLPRS